MLSPSRFDGLRGSFAPQVNPVLGLEVVHSESSKGQPVAGPTHDQIAQRAYEIYLRRAGAPGTAEGDWALARQELESESANNTERSTPGAASPSANRSVRPKPRKSRHQSA
jgi:hypothetical protein